MSLASSARLPISVVVLTLNEERNLEACLGSLAGWVDEIFVVDSGSTDRTISIAETWGATVHHHPFETHARQWQWALDALPLTHVWVLGLDADQQVTPELRDEMMAAVPSLGPDVVGAYVRRRQIFRGRWIRHGGYYPKYLLKLFRRRAVWLDEAELVDHHFHVRGRTVRFRHDLIEDNRNEADIAAWTAKHNRYAALQAHEQLARARGSSGAGLRASPFGTPDERVRWLKGLWNRLPLYWRPCLYFFYRYIIRLGFLDGREGFLFHALQAFWYRLLVDIHVDQLRRHEVSEPLPAVGTAPGNLSR